MVAIKLSFAITSVLKCTFYSKRIMPILVFLSDMIGWFILVLDHIHSSKWKSLILELNSYVQSTCSICSSFKTYPTYFQHFSEVTMDHFFLKVGSKVDQKWPASNHLTMFKRANVVRK